MTVWPARVLFCGQFVQGCRMLHLGSQLGSLPRYASRLNSLFPARMESLPYDVSVYLTTYLKP